MKHQFTPRGVCSQKIEFELEDGKLKNVSFLGGCSGNLKAIGKLVEGMEADKVIALLGGNTCGFNSTSCADQLAIAIQQAQEQQRRAG
ncbi:MAG TPA: TIGR03905 family TSCPD domain-containing protein [Feifaniaceae bacterium]|nr:TIGR03905 family TSCPD domain-containing protein [Feifaniaceae bacterium]